jgi:hypothetical protein
MCSRERTTLGNKEVTVEDVGYSKKLRLQRQKDFGKRKSIRSAFVSEQAVHGNEQCYEIRG